MQCFLKRFFLDYNLFPENDDQLFGQGVFGSVWLLVLVYSLYLGEVKGTLELQHQHVCVDMCSDEDIPGIPLWTVRLLGEDEP